MDDPVRTLDGSCGPDATWNEELGICQLPTAHEEASAWYEGDSFEDFLDWQVGVLKSDTSRGRQASSDVPAWIVGVALASAVAGGVLIGANSKSET